MNSSRILLPFLALTACTSERPEDLAPNDSSVPSCVDGTTTTTVMVPEVQISPSATTVRAWTIASVATASSTIAQREDADGSLVVALVDGTGASTLASIPAVGKYRTRAAGVAGTSCAVFVNDVAGMFYGCAGAAPEDAGIDHLGSDRAPIPFKHADGTLSVYTQSFASFTMVQRDPAGAWREYEQFESSISYPTDVAAIADEPSVCFISSGDHAVIESGVGKLVSAAESATCHLASDGTTLHVLTDGGHARLEPAGMLTTMFATTPVPALANLRVEETFVEDGVAYALVNDSGTVKAIPLAGGDPIVIDTVTGSGILLDWDDASKSIRIVTSKVERASEGTMHPQTIEVRTRCMP